MSPKEVKKEIKKLVYEKPVLIGLGDTLNLGLGANCSNGSHDQRQMHSPGVMRVPTV